MSYKKSSLNDKNHQIMSEEKFDQIIDAILAGKYSWACVLILETAGYNPQHYIPYRTYNRLIKNNCISSQSNYQPKTEQEQTKSSKTSKQYKSDTKIKDLNRLRTNQNKEIQGGNKFSTTTNP